MAQAERDQNFVTTLLAVSSVDGVTPVTLYADPVTHRLLVNLASGDGTVTDVSVVTANGFAGSVANSTTTPAITLSTTVTGVLKGNGTAISAASSATDYAAVAFKTIAVAGQSDIVADTPVDTLTIVGSGVTITTDAGTDTLTFTVAVPSQITVANEAADTTTFPLFVTAATGDLQPKTNAGLTFDSVNQDLVVGGDLSAGDDLLFPNAGSVINFNAGDVTITHSANLLAVAGGDWVIRGAQSLRLDNGANNASFYIFNNGGSGANAATFTAFGTAELIINDNSITTTTISPKTDGAADLGTTTLGFQNLHLNTLATINIDNSNWVATHTSGILTVGTGDLRVTTAGTNTASVVTVGGTQTLTSKTITNSNNVLGGVTMTLGSDADGDMYYRSSNVLTRLPKGTANQLLRMNSGATAPEWATVGGTQFTATADEDLTAGQTVGISVYTPSGGVARALRRGTTGTLTFTPADSGDFSDPNRSCVLATDKYVFGAGVTADDSLTCQVVSINTSTKTQTLGTASAATTDLNTNFAMCQLDTDKFAVFYREDASTTIVKYRVATVSGTTITWGTAATFATGATAINGNLAACQIGTDKGMVYMNCSTGTDTRVFCFTASGTVLTVGTGATVGANMNGGHEIVMSKVATDKFIMMSGSGYIQIGTVSGTTITMGSQVQFETSMNNDSSFMRMVNSADDVITMVYKNGSSGIDMRAMTVSGTVPTLGTELGAVVTGGEATSIGMVGEDATTYLLFASNTASITKVTRSGTTLTSAGVVGSQITGNGFTLLQALYLATYWVWFGSASTTWGTWIQGMTNMFNGIAASTVSKGQSVVVTAYGRDANQSGLVPGRVYQADGTGGLTAISIATTINTADDKFGTALSSTEIIL